MKCPYNQGLCKNDDNSYGCHGKHYENCPAYQDITKHLVELLESGKLEEIMEEEYDIGVLL